MKNFSIKRFTASLLFIVMVVAALPVSLFNFTISAGAAEVETTYVLAGSDFQASSHDEGATIVNGLLDKIKVDYPTMNGFLFAGDYHVQYTDSANGKAKLQETVQAVYGTGMDEIYVQGNHDGDSLVGSTLTASGANDAENYGVFVINEKDYMWRNDDEATIKKTAEHLEAYLNAKRNAGYTKPIFVISHLPLHYSMRTRSGGNDGMHANYIFDVLNEAGNAGLNIIFLFGHDHSHGWDDYLGGAAIYLAKGDKINIAQNSTTVFKEETLAFTYMNAGYVGYYGTSYTSDVDKTLTMSVFEITGDTVTVKRYDSEGLHDLKSTGVYNVEYPDNAYYSTNSTVKSSPQTINLNKTITSAGGESGGKGGNTESGTATSIERVYTLEAGNYYIIVSDRNNMVLTGTATTDKDGHNALLLSGTAGVDTTDLWYYDGTNFIYGGPEDTDKYLLMDTNSAYLGGTHSYRMADAYLNNDGTTFSIGRSQAADKVYLNQYGGSGYTAASPYTSDGNSDDGSKWVIYKVNLAEKELASFSANGVTVTAPGITGLNVTVETGTVDGYSAYKSYDINPENYTQGNEATVDIELDMTIFSANRPVVIIDNGTVIATVNITDGKVSFKTSHFSVYAVAQASVATSGGTWVTITEPTNGTTTYTYTQATSITAGGKYVIVANSNPVALMDNNGSMGSQTVTISGSTMTSTVALTEWTFSGSDRGTIYNGTRYLHYNNNRFSLNQNQSSTVYITDNGSNFKLSGSSNASRGYSLYYTGSTWSTSGRYTQYVRLYQLTDTTTTGGTNGEYAKIDGALAYEVKIDTSKEDALAKVKAGITGYTNTTASDPGTLLDDNDLNWTLDPSYDGTVPGEYAVTIEYNGKTLGVAKVKVLTAVIEDATISPNEGSVERGSRPNVPTGATITLTYDNGNTTTVDVTVGMLTGNFDINKNGTYTGLTVTYGGYTFDNFTLEVTNVSGNDYPEYPNEGAVKVSKTAIYTSEDFRKTGVAQVELSVSGVPSKKGADVIVMLDLSSSMGNTVDGQTRLAVLRSSLEKMMTQLKAKGDDDQPMDIRIAVADFHRYYTDSSSPYYIDSADHLAGGSIRTNVNGTNKVYTNMTDQNPDGKLDASAFVSVHNLEVNAFDSISTSSGTNYDYAFDAVYQLGEAITSKNATDGKDRDLFVIFMSDGAPFQFNYFSSQSEGSGASYWNNWLQGTMTDAMFDSNARNDYYNENGKHWMADAIKGDPSSTYPVIRKNNSADTDGDTWVNVNGLGAKMYSIGFCLAVDKEITVDSMDTVIRNIASSDQYYFRANTANDLDNAFTQIGHDIAYAATNARFVDQMGTAFDLQMAFSVTRMVDGMPVYLNFTPTITVKTYDIWTRQDYLSNKCTIEQIGVRKGTYTVLETITFNADGTEAYSSLDSVGPNGETIPAGQNILINDVIYASTFFYNNNKGNNVTISTTADGEYSLASETFYWKVGTVQTKELAISYYVYLTDTLEGERDPGSYATNNFAILYYDNYLGNACEKHTVSPMLAWKEANVSYAFYLVDTNGKVIVNRATGETGPFANKVAVTRPVVFGTCKLNTETNVSAIEILETDGILPDGYQIFDASASYSVVVLSDWDDKVIGWEINKADVATTYVTGYSTTDPYSNAQSMHETGYDYTHTTVWFAVVWRPSTIPDQVVIDYGLPVDISVLENDLFESGAKLNGVADSGKKPVLANNGYVSNHDANFLSTRTSAFGTAAINGTKVRYTPLNMQMNTYDSFAYEVEYVINNETQYYYGDVTVIPATTIYYEESFVKFNDADPNDGTYGVWVNEGTAVEGVQAEDRPGKDSLGTIDHDNVYGYDAINNSSTEYSLGTAKKVSVNSTYGYHKDNSPTASFTFTGTGFDIISMTNSDSGVIFITATNTETGKSTNKFVDNYYGYTYDETNGWTPTPDPTAAIYQVPVMKISGLDYGTYDVTIWVTYGEYFDHDGTEGYSFWLDSIRIYDPANGGATDNDSIIEDAYEADNESNPHYLQIKDAILAASDVNTDKLSGIVFIDGKTSTVSVADYTNPGPNNEAYLAKGQSISFKLQSNATPLDVQIGVKLAYGDSADVQFTYTVGSKSESKVRTFTTATDMYYSIASYMGLVHDNQQNNNAVAWTSGTITLTNTSDSVISLTNVKATFKLANYPVSGSMSTTSKATDSASVFSLMSSHNRTLTTSTLEATEETMPVSISFLVDAEVIEDACAVMTALYAPEPEIFVPEALEYTVTNRFFGNSTVNVITSKDVASLTVNGVEAKKLSNSPLFSMLFRLIDVFEGRFGTNISAKDYIVWSASVKRASNYDIVAYNADGLSSDPTVTDSSSSITKEDLDNYFNRSELYSIMEQMASRRFDPEQFEAYVNERFDGFREIITETSEDVEYVVINGKIVDRYITETVIDTETGETTTKRVWITDAEDDVEDEDVEVNAYDEKGVGSESKKAERKFGWKKNSNNSNNGNSNSASDKNNNKENNGKGNSGKYVGM